LQHLQEIQPALAVGALEVGKQVVADDRAKAVVTLVSGPGIIGTDVGRHHQCHGQQLRLFLMKDLLILGQNTAQLASGDVDAEVPQFLQEQGLRDVIVVILVQNIGDQLGAEMAARENVVR
jgi:hypothetical protein